jgi:hypothetical protein
VLSNQFEEDETGEVYSTNGGEEERVWVTGGNAREKETTRKAVI